MTLRLLQKPAADAIQRELDEITNNPNASRSGMFVKSGPEDQIAVPTSVIIGYHRREVDD